MVAVMSMLPAVTAMVTSELSTPARRWQRPARKAQARGVRVVADALREEPSIFNLYIQ